MPPPFQTKVINTKNLPAGMQQTIITFCSQAYEEDLGPLFTTFVDPVHVLGYQAGRLVSHAMWVTRWLQVGQGPLLRTAYVEMVATAKTLRGRGYATAVMRRLAAEIQHYDLGALSTGIPAYYERLGWELWRGPLSIRTAAGLVPTPGEEAMILRLPQTPPLDLHDPLSAEWRAGELW